MTVSWTEIPVQHEITPIMTPQPVPAKATPVPQPFQEASSH